MLSGTKFSRYEIQKKIGYGGMGEVYLAHDEQLDRQVALKILLPEFCCNLERMQRFKLEARAASALNHPNIITIYEIGEADERLFIATEYVDGVTLRERIETGDLTVAEAVKIAEQAADALAVTHEAHIVHRDIKPENIMIRRRDKIVKILDFGLAKATLHPESGTEEETLKLVQTQAGMVIGSVRYMSPEQARGREIDGRSDIWSLGVVLYEMLSGINPFAGETVSDSLAALIHIEPPPLENVPKKLERIVRKTLHKNADERYLNIKDLAVDLREAGLSLEHSSAENNGYAEDAQNNKTATVKRQFTNENPTLIHKTKSLDNLTGEDLNETRIYSTNQRRKRNFLPLLILPLAVLLAAAAWYFQSFSKTEREDVFKSVQVSRITESGNAGVGAISPDGKYVAYVNNESGLRSLNVRQVATGSSVQIVPPINWNFLTPTFSKDGNYIYYVSVEKAVGTLYQIPTLGGTPRRLIVDVDSPVSLSPDGKRLAFKRHLIDTNTDAIIIAQTDGTEAQQFITSAEVGTKGFSEVAWSPTENKLLTGSFEPLTSEKSFSSKLMMISLDDKKIEPFGGDQIWLNANSFGWLKNGSGVLMLGKKTEEEQQQIWFVSYPAGEARQITNDSSGYVRMSYAEDGDTIAALKSDVISSLWSLNTQTNKLKQITAENRDMLGANGIAQMPDGKIIVTKVEGNTSNLWLMDENGRELTQITKDAGMNVHPAITPDGKQIVFSSNRTGNFQIWKSGADGKNPVRVTTNDDEAKFRPLILADGKTVIFESYQNDRMHSKLMKINIDGGVPERVFSGEMSEIFPELSPDGKRLLYTVQSFNSESLVLKSEVKTAALKDGQFILDEKPLNLDGGYQYEWAADGKSIVHIDRQGIPNLVSVFFDNKNQPKHLTEFPSGEILNFKSSSDGKRFFIVRAIINSDLILIKDVISK